MGEFKTAWMVPAEAVEGACPIRPTGHFPAHLPVDFGHRARGKHGIGRTAAGGKADHVLFGPCFRQDIRGESTVENTVEFVGDHDAAPHLPVEAVPGDVRGCNIGAGHGFPIDSGLIPPDIEGDRPQPSPVYLERRLIHHLAPACMDEKGAILHGAEEGIAGQAMGGDGSPGREGNMEGYGVAPGKEFLQGDKAGFAGPAGGMFPAPHGAVCARLLPYVIAMNVRALQERFRESDALRRYEEIAQLLTGSEVATINDGVEWVQELCDALEVPPLSSYGMTEKDIPALVEKAAQSSSMKGNPVTLTPDELTEILTRAM